MSEWKNAFIHAAAPLGFPIHRPYYQLTESEKRLLWHGNQSVYGIDSFFKMVEENLYKIQYRVMLARYRGKTNCPECNGSRLRKDALYVKIGGLNIGEIVRMPVSELREWFRNLQLSETDTIIAKRLLTEIRNRLDFLCDVGLEYLTLDRLSSSLSGGESQRINLATSLGSSLVGSIYILDEPSIGLHSRDTEKLIRILRKLQQIGNTVVVVEHDEEIIRAADYIIDIGPKAGRLGGQVVYEGDMNDLRPGSDSYTVRYLLGEERIPLPPHHRTWNNYIDVRGARENNLRGIDVRFPLNVMTVVTGVSGSGKSTLVTNILYRALKREYGEGTERPGEYVALEGDIRATDSVQAWVTVLEADVAAGDELTLSAVIEVRAVAVRREEAEMLTDAERCYKTTQPVALPVLVAARNATFSLTDETEAGEVDKVVLADAQTKSLKSRERGKAIIQENWEFLARYFIKEYAR